MPGVCTSLKQEFQLKKFGFGYEKPHHFSLSEWTPSHYAYVAWRVFWALWHVVWIAISIKDHLDLNEPVGKWFIYLTHWSYLLLGVQSLVHAGIVIHNCCRARYSPVYYQGENRTRWHEKLLWFLTAVTFEANVVVTIMYWGFIQNEETNAGSIMTHGVNTLYVIIDCVIVANPTRLLHALYGSLYGIVYTLFTLFYHLAHGTNKNGEPYIYKLTDWTKPGQVVAFAVVLNLVVVPVVHAHLYCLYAIRFFVSGRLQCGRRSSGEDDDGVLI